MSVAILNVCCFHEIRQFSYCGESKSVLSESKCRRSSGTRHRPELMYSKQHFVFIILGDTISTEGFALYHIYVYKKVTANYL
jgi:hypothetical protein